MPRIGVVADDLTGAMTTGVLLAKAGLKTAVFLDERKAEQADGMEAFNAVLISTNSRPLGKQEAQEKVERAGKALKAMGAEFFSKRIDTTLRGNIGAEIDAMLDQMEPGTIAVVVPAMPQSRRILAGGFSIIDGKALVRTPAARDVRTPVRENYIPRLLEGQTRRKVGLITLSAVLEGEAAIKAALDQKCRDGCEAIVVDAVSEEDVAEIARACVALDRKILAADPGAFTEKFVRCRMGSKGEKRDGSGREKDFRMRSESTEESEKTVLVAAGSATPVTAAQIGALCQDSRHIQISVDPIALIEGGERAEEEEGKAVQTVQQLLEEAVLPRAIVLETALHGEVIRLGEEDEKRNLKPGGSAERINEGLGRIVCEIVKQYGEDKIAGLYATGGDTLASVCQCLGVQYIEAVDHVIPQADIGRLAGGVKDGLWIAAKGGLTGNDRTACEIVDRLLRESRSTLRPRRLAALLPQSL